MKFKQLQFNAKAGLLPTALFALLLLVQMGASHAIAETRTISFYMINTAQKLTVTYKIDGRYVPAALQQINRVVWDWRAKESIRMDPKLIDIIWELHRELGSKREIRVISGYRSPKTNAMLRQQSKGVAKKSNHMLGLAMDVQFPDVNIRTLREAGLLKRAGGIGYYPRSRIPFVHIDVGTVRHWPRMKSAELAALFKRGKPFGGYKVTPQSQSTTIASKTSKTPQGNNFATQRIIVASAPKPEKRPGLPDFAPTKPLTSPGSGKIKPSISDPELLNEQILLASIFADEEDGDILSLAENLWPDEVTTKLSGKQDLSFYPIRDYPDLAIYEVPISIGLTNNDAHRLLNQNSNRFIGGFQKIPYPSLTVQPFR
ncbi:MAG: DUF882 domain-containing protein [Rhizobiales bacterium]|nr:DUF882 domain-containing protein [Hyphomicrobiales bacterium]NRB14748.1 DUF882 domain-containing protein [Hyphomicrobiales bacterium]